MNTETLNLRIQNIKAAIERETEGLTADELRVVHAAVATGDAEAERIRICAYLGYDTVYSEDFCVRCSHEPTNCECVSPVYMAGWSPDETLRALKVALFQEFVVAPSVREWVTNLVKAGVMFTQAVKVGNQTQLQPVSRKDVESIASPGQQIQGNESSLARRIAEKIRVKYGVSTFDANNRPAGELIVNAKVDEIASLIESELAPIPTTPVST